MCSAWLAEARLDHEPKFHIRAQFLLLLLDCGELLQQILVLLQQILVLL